MLRRARNHLHGNTSHLGVPYRAAPFFVVAVLVLVVVTLCCVVPSVSYLVIVRRCSRAVVLFCCLVIVLLIACPRVVVLTRDRYCCAIVLAWCHVIMPSYLNYAISCYHLSFRAVVFIWYHIVLPSRCVRMVSCRVILSLGRRVAVLSSCCRVVLLSCDHVIVLTVSCSRGVVLPVRDQMLLLLGSIVNGTKFC